MLVCKSCGKVLAQCCDLYFPCGDGTVLCGDCYKEENDLTTKDLCHTLEVVCDDLLEKNSSQDVLYEYVATKSAIDNDEESIMTQGFRDTLISRIVDSIPVNPMYAYTKRKKLSMAAAVILLEFDKMDQEEMI